MDLQSRTLAVCHVASAAFEWLVVGAAGWFRLASGGLLKSPLHFVKVGHRIVVDQKNILLRERLFADCALERSRWIQKLLHGKVWTLSEWQSSFRLRSGILLQRAGVTACRTLFVLRVTFISFFVIFSQASWVLTKGLVTHYHDVTVH